MKLDYGTLLSKSPITLSMGHIKKPTLQDISDISFMKFGFYELLSKLTPKRYYHIFFEETGKELWDSIPKEEKEKITMYSLILDDENLRESYLDMLNFFFEEEVYFAESIFILATEAVESFENLEPGMICGFINEDYFRQVMLIIQQICCIAEKETEDISELKFKNEKARKMYERMQKAQEEQREKNLTKGNKDLSLPNIISAVSTKHPSINLCNIWELTVFQLLDTFNRLQNNSMYDIESTRVSVWGDEKKKFDATLWYKNNNDD